MTNEKLVYRLTIELFGLKQKLEDIRKKAENIYYSMDIESKYRIEIIEIINELDSGEIYED